MKQFGDVLIHSIVANRYPARIRRYQQMLDYNGIKCRLVDASVDGFWESAAACRCYIHHFVHRETEKQVAEAVLPVIEDIYERPCFPNRLTRWHYDDKIKQYYLLQARGFPVVASWVFWDKRSAIEWLESASFPLVFKLKGGAGSKNVVLLSDRKRAIRIAKRMFDPRGIESEYVPDAGSLSRVRNRFGLYKLRQWLAAERGKIHYQDVRPYWQRQRDYVYLQKFLPSNEFDTRVTVIGGRAFAFRRWNRPGDFRASGSGHIDYAQDAVDKRCIELAFAVSESFGFQSMAYDMLYDEDGQPRIGEISYTYLDKAVYDCPGYYDKEMNWIPGNFWPQFCILQDLLSEPGLSQPVNKTMDI